jgi:excisionase family DNA binding protein
LNRMELRERFAPPLDGAMDEQDILLTLKEAKAYLRVSRSTLYRFMNTGRLIGHKVGVTWRFYRSDLRACIDSEPVDLVIPTDGTPIDYSAQWYRCRDRDCACQQKYAQVHAIWYATWTQNGRRVRKCVGKKKPEEARE